MTVLACGLITLTVWAVSLVRSPRLQAFIYSLPAPMTLVLATSPITTDGSQVLGVLGLVGFFFVVAALHSRLRVPIWLAVAAGAGTYVGYGTFLAGFDGIPMAPALAIFIAVWLTAMILARVTRSGSRSATTGPAPTDAPRSRIPALMRLVITFCGAFAMLLTGGLLHGLVVTFPYSGVLVAFQARRSLTRFSRQFLHQSPALSAFLAGYTLTQHYSPATALGVGWIAHALTSAALHLPSLATGRLGRARWADKD